MLLRDRRDIIESPQLTTVPLLMENVRRRYRSSLCLGLYGRSGNEHTRGRMWSGTERNWETLVNPTMMVIIMQRNILKTKKDKEIIALSSQCITINFVLLIPRPFVRFIEHIERMVVLHFICTFALTICLRILGFFPCHHVSQLGFRFEHLRKRLVYW